MKTLSHLSPNGVLNLKNISNEENEDYKPNGLWMQLDKSWEKFLEYNPELRRGQKYDHKIAVKDGADICKVITSEDVDKLTKRFSSDGEIIDWELFSYVYDGIYVSQETCGSDTAAWIWSWDVESLCVWNTDMLIVK